jgi:hypothetical protein
MAMLTALRDKDTRQKLLDVAKNLRKKNFVEGTAEDLSEGKPALLGRRTRKRASCISLVV